MPDKLNIIILAAGRGSRMGSSLPKVLHPVGGQPMIARVLRAASEVSSEQIRVVLGHGAQLISPIVVKYQGLSFKQDDKKWGTASAVQAARPEELEGLVLILNGDHPLISHKDLDTFIQNFYKQDCDCAIGSFEHKQPHEYGTIIKEGEQVTKIVEARDRSQNEQGPSLVNAGIYAIRASVLKKYLSQIPKSPSGEYYLTEIVQLLNKDSLKVRAIPVTWNLAFGVNNQYQLSLAGNVVFENKCYELMNQGVIIVDIKNTYIESDVIVEAGSMIYPNVYLKGNTRIGSFCAIESHSFIFDSIIKNYVNIKSGSYLEKSQVDEKSIIGPYAHLREGTNIGKSCRIGNFVETKKLEFGDKSKASHLSYLGDAEVGEEVNIGCSTVTCNYGLDKKKRKVKIQPGAFIGSGSQLVAPVEIGKDAVVGAGSVITKDVPEKSLALERTEQKHIQNYRNRKKE